MKPSEFSDEDRERFRFVDFAKICPFYQTFKPLILYGQLFGQFYKTTGKQLFPYLKIYCFIVALLLFGLIIRMGFRFDGNERIGSATLTKIMFLDLYLLSAFSHLCILIAQTKVAPLFYELKRSLEPHEPPYLSGLYSLCIGLLIVLVFIASVNSVCNVLVSSGMINVTSYTGLVPGQPWIDGIIAWYVTTGVSFCSAFYCMLCVMVYANTKHLCKSMVEYKNTYEPITLTIDYYRIRFQSLLDCIRQITESFGFFCFGNFAISIPQICSVLYIFFVKDGVSTGEFVVLGFWLAISLFQLFYVAIPAILVNDQGSTLYWSVHKMRQNLINELSQTDRAEIHYFAQQIRGSEFGISACGFFTITRSLMITLFSAIATYFIIIIQFHGMGDNSGITLNATFYREQ